jgi:DNA primase
MYPDENGKYRCISGSHEDNHPSMSLHPSGEFLHCFVCGETSNIFAVAAWHIGVSNDRAHFREIVEDIEKALGIPSEWKPSLDERRAYYRKNRDAAGKQMVKLSASAVYRDGLLREMAEAVDYGNQERAFFFAELLLALFMLPEEIVPETKEPSWMEKERKRMARDLRFGK